MVEAAKTPLATTPVAGAQTDAAKAQLEKENQELKERVAQLEEESKKSQGGAPAAQSKGRLTTPVRFISRYRRYKPHLKQVSEDFGTHKSNRVVTAQFADLTYLCEDAEIAELIRGMKQFRKNGDTRPGGEVWEMLPGENLKKAMDRLGIKDTGEVIQYSGQVDSRMANQAR